MALVTLACSSESGTPFLLLITTDTLRADHVGAYGGPDGITPHLDSLAQDSIVFDVAYAPASYTLPSIAALLSGRYPEEVGILENVNLFKPRDGLATLPEILRVHGWRTGAAVSNHVLRRGTGIEKGFGVYDDTLTEIEANRSQPERSAAATTRAALGVLDSIREGEAAGLFLWVHYQDPHGPYQPPDGLRERFLEFANAASDAERILPSRGINPRSAIPSYQLVENRHDVGFYRAGYAGEVRNVDDEIGKLIDGLDERNLWDDAVVVFTADHGESLGEDEYWFAHGALLSDVLVRIPLIMRIPGADRARRGDIVSLVDLLPTLLTYFGIDAADALHGRDVLAEGAEEAGGRAYLASLLGGSTKHYGWVEDGFKYVSTRPRRGPAVEALWSLNLPSRNVAKEEAAKTRQLRTRLELFRDELEIVDAVEQTLRPIDREMLRRLGYLEPEG